MDNLQIKTTAPPRRPPFFLVGVLLFLLGPAIYFVRFRMHHLEVPWYAAILATLGVLLMLVSVCQRRSIWRVAGLLLLVLLCGFEWFMLLIATRTPLYTGPAEKGHKVPAFATTLADGKPFANSDIETGTPTVLLFFRGRW